MKKSIMLSTTIMLIILFVALTTTTFAWYQAQAGEITIDASSTASVTTTGPDSPYLVISRTDSGDWASANSTNYSSYLTTTFDASSTVNELSLLAKTGNNLLFSNTAFTNVATGADSQEALCLTFYVKNTSASFSLKTIINVTATIGETNNVDLTGNSDNSGNYGYGWALVIGSGDTETIKHSRYHLADGTLVAAGLGLNNTATITNTNDANVIAGGAILTCYFYLWIDGYGNNGTKITNSNGVSSVPDISNLKITFSSVAINA